MRFKMQTFSAIRDAFRIVIKITEIPTKDLLKAKLQEQDVDVVAFYLDALEGLNLSENLEEQLFNNAIADAERHALVSFANLMYKQQNP